MDHLLLDQFMMDEVVTQTKQTLSSKAMDLM
jgi:hypothetical protein